MTISEQIRAAVDEAARKYPELGLSFGYIGNVYYGPYGDDRSWKVFAKLATNDCWNACNVSFGGYSTEQLEGFLEEVLHGQRFPAWLENTQRRLDAGEIRQVSPEKWRKDG